MIPIKYSGSMQDSSGYGSANRAFVTALHMAGVDVTVELVVTQKERTTFGWEGSLAYALQERDIPYKIKIIHLTADLAQTYIEKDKYNILHLFWETDKLPEGWAAYCNNFAEVWTSSPNMAHLFKESGVRVPIYSFPQPIDITVADKPFRRYVIPQHKGFLFYSVFQWIERKNPKALLQAYWEEFEGQSDVSLLLKTFRLGYDMLEFEKIAQDIQDWRLELPIKKFPRVLLSRQVMTQEEIYKLHYTGDCFVTAHRGEGWCRPVQEALLMGKPVIATARGGIHEYLKDNHYFGVPSTYIPVTEVPYIKFYTKDQNWADINKEELKKNMRYVFDHPELSTAKGIAASGYIKENFNYRKLGDMMLARLQIISKSL